jgi:GNAT superfamily N-acetyltransferase
VAFNWANPHEFSGNLCRFDLEPDEAYLYDAYTIPDYRGKRLAPYLRYQTYRCLSRRGMNRIYSISDAFNTPSIRFKQKLKARFVKLGLSIQLLNRRTYNITLRQLPDFKNRLQASVQEE